MADFIFGFDFFISYAQRDGLGYPDRLAAALEKQGYKVCVDRRHYQAGEVLQLLTRRHVRNSNTLVIVARPGALSSSWVLRETQECLQAGRTPLAIDINKALFSAPDDNPLKALLGDRLYIPELLEDADGFPSDAILQRLQNRFAGLRQESLRMRLLAGSAALFVIIAGVATWQWRTAVYRRDQAASRLISQRVANGTRAVFDGDLWAAWSWYANALALARSTGLDEQAHRERLHGLREQMPHLRQLFHRPDRIRAAVISPGSDRVALYLREDARFEPRVPSRNIELYTLHDGSRTAALMIGDSEVIDMRFSPVGDELWTLECAYGSPTSKGRIAARIRSVPSGEQKTSIELDAEHPIPRWLDEHTLAIIDNHSAHILKYKAGAVEVRSRTGPAEERTYVSGISRDAGLLASFRWEQMRLLIRRADSQNDAYSLDFGHSPTVAFSTDGSFLITIEIKKLTFWELGASARKVAEQELDGFSKELKFLRSGDLLITEDRGDEALVSTLWDVRTGRLLRSFDHEKIAARWEFPSELGNRAGAGAASVAGGGLANPFEHLTATSADGTRLLTVSKKNRSYRIWDLESGEALTAPFMHGGAELRSVQFSGDGRGIVSTANDGLVKVWDVALPRRARPLIGQPDVIKSLRFLGSGDRLLCLSGGTARIYDWRSGELHGVVGEGFSKLTFVTQGAALAGQQEDRFRLFNADSLTPRTEWLPHPGIDGIAVSERGRYAATWDEGYDRLAKIRLWDLNTGTQLTEFAPGLTYLRDVALDEATGIAAFVGWTKNGRGETLAVHQLARKTTTISQGFRSFSFQGLFRSAPAAALLIFDGRSFWSLGPTGDRESRPYASSKSALTHFMIASADGTRVLLTDSDQQIAQLIDVKSGEPLTPEFRHEWPMTQAEFLPDGSRLLTVSGNRIHIWDLKTGEAVVPVIRYPDTVTAAALHPQGRAFVAGARQRVDDHGFALFIHPVAMAAGPDEALVAYGEAGGWHRVDSVGARLPIPASQVASSWSALSRSNATVLDLPDSEVSWLRQVKRESGLSIQMSLYYIEKILALAPRDREVRTERAHLYGIQGDHKAFLTEVDNLWEQTPPSDTIRLTPQQARQWTEWLLALDRPKDAQRVLANLETTKENYDGWLFALASFGAGDLRSHRANAESMLRRAAELAKGEGPWQEKWNAAYHAAFSSLLTEDTKAELNAAVGLAVAAARSPELEQTLRLLRAAAALRSGNFSEAGDSLNGLDSMPLAKALVATLEFRLGHRARAQGLVAELLSSLKEHERHDLDSLLAIEVRYLLRPIGDTSPPACSRIPRH